MAQTRASLAADLRALGLAPGDTVWCHSSYSSLGAVEGGPQTVLDAFGDALGPEGLLVLPSFNLLEGGAENRMAHWDPATSPSTVGWLTEYARTAPDGLTHRSDHFSHAATARGKGAAECAPVPPSALRHHSQPERNIHRRGWGRFTGDHLLREGRRSPWDSEQSRWGRAHGAGSPMIKSYDAGGKLLMLGTLYDSSTYMHIVETVLWVRAQTPQQSFTSHPCQLLHPSAWRHDRHCPTGGGSVPGCAGAAAVGGGGGRRGRAQHRGAGPAHRRRAPGDATLSLDQPPRTRRLVGGGDAGR